LTDLPMNNDRHTEMKYAFFPGEEKGGCGALVKLEEVKPGNGGTIVYFASEEINDELSRVEAAGGKIIRPKLEINEYGFMAFIEDTEGNLIGLYSTK
jgi:predicted enzyme related to lactoylglutathione lyase